MAEAWRNRICGHRDVPPGELAAHPSNWRSHPEAQRKGLRQVVETVGLVQDVIVSKRTGRILDGHLRVEEAIAAEQPTIPIVEVDVTEDEERVILASFDVRGSMAEINTKALKGLLGEVGESDLSAGISVVLDVLHDREDSEQLNPGLFSSATDDWATPQDLFDELNREFKFELDVCASPGNAKCERYFTAEQDGLKQEWSGRCWCNPPYGRTIGLWVAKARESAAAGALVVCLLPARTDTSWWHDDVIEGDAEIRFLKGRLKFGGADNSAPFPSAVVVFRPKRAAVQDDEPHVSKADELREKWQTASGQLWQLGEHRLVCGDATNADAVKRVLDGERATLVFTDPPYGVAVGSKNAMLNTVQPSGRCCEDITDDTLTPDELKARLLPAFVNVRELAMADDCTVFVTAPQGGELGMMMMMRESGLPPRHVLVWLKNSPTFSLGRLDYDYQHEPILMTWTKRHKRLMRGEHRTSVWPVDKPRASKDHPTMKPVALVINAMLNHAEAGDVVFDPYSGSGTTILAAENTNTRARAIEIDPGYVAVALQRFADATGKTPTLIG